MSENPTSSSIGQDKIDAYLDAVERALIAANAPRTDRMQVVQDLESQINEMLTQQSSPRTEELVQSVIAKLEPPSHFAETYGTTASAAAPRSIAKVNFPQHNRWIIAAAVSVSLIPLGILSYLMVFASGGNAGPLLTPFFRVFFCAGIPIGILFTPIAYWMGYNQLRKNPNRYLGRELALGTMVAYVTLVPSILLFLLCIFTAGIILFPIAIASIIWFGYLIILRLWRRLSAILPPNPEVPLERKPNGHSVPPQAPFTSANSVPAV